MEFENAQGGEGQEAPEGGLFDVAHEADYGQYAGGAGVVVEEVADAGGHVIGDCGGLLPGQDFGAQTVVGEAFCWVD